MNAARANLGVEVVLGMPSANAARALAELRDRGGKAQAFELARALGVSLAALASTLAWLEGHGLAACAVGWSLTDEGLDRLRAGAIADAREGAGAGAGALRGTTGPGAGRGTPTPRGRAGATSRGRR